MRRLPGALPRAGLALLLAGAIAWSVANRHRFDGAAIVQGVAALGDWAPLVYVGLYVLATVLFLPGSILGLAGGALFGPVWGTVYTLIGATVGATLAFLAARYIASDWVAAKAGGRLKQLIDGVEAEGWRFVAFVRLVPIFPFNLLNYALGLTRIRLLDYVLASFVCMMPGTIAYTYLGYAGREALGGGESILQKALIALGLIAAAAFLPRLVRQLRQRTPQAGEVRWIEVPEFADRLRQKPAPIVIDVRGADEFVGDLGHIPAATNLPVADLGVRLTEINAQKDQAVILVCRTDKRSAKAAGILEAAGFRDVRVLRGGMEQWTQSNLTVEGRAASQPV